MFSILNLKCFFKYVFIVEYFSMFLYIYIFYFLDIDNFTNISLSYFFIYYIIMKLKKFIKTIKKRYFFFTLNLKYFENTFVLFNCFSFFNIILL